MKALVVGGGSIGKRHMENLRVLGVSEVCAVEPDQARRERLSQEIDVATYSDLNAGLKTLPDFVVIASPTHLHASQATQAAQQGFHLFVEKPLSHEERGLFELSTLCERHHLISMVACNMRFHPGPARIKQLLSERRIGKVLFARIHVGSYLPGWRSGTDYRGNYAARRTTGGGCILDCIHEIDLARWYLGEVSEVLCMAGHLSSLDIDTEDVAALIFRHESGAISEIHLDYVQRTYERGCEIIGETGSIRWDFNQGKVRLFLADNPQRQDFPQPDGWEPNQMYLDEMKDFLNCVEQRKETVLSIADAVRVTRIALAAKESAETGRRVSPAKEVLV